MRTQRLQYGRFALAVFLATSLVVLPEYGATGADAPNGTRVEVKTYRIQEPLPNQPIVLPDEIPAEARPAVLEAIRDTKPGGPPIMVVPPGALEKYGDAVKQAVEEAVPRGVTGGSGLPLFIATIAFWVVVIVAILVVAVIIYVLWKLSQLVPPPQTNAPPGDPYPAVVTRGTVGGKGFVRSHSLDRKLLYAAKGPTLYSESADAELQANVNLATTNWFTLCRFHIGTTYEVTNGISSTYWALVTAAGTNGDIVASTLVSGTLTDVCTTNLTATMVQEKSDPLVIPAPRSDKMFFRLK